MCAVRHIHQYQLRKCAWLLFARLSPFVARPARDDCVISASHPRRFFLTAREPATGSSPPSFVSIIESCHIRSSRGFLLRRESPEDRLSILKLSNYQLSRPIRVTTVREWAKLRAGLTHCAALCFPGPFPDAKLSSVLLRYSLLALWRNAIASVCNCEKCTNDIRRVNVSVSRSLISQIRMYHRELKVSNKKEKDQFNK